MTDGKAGASEPFPEEPLHTALVQKGFVEGVDTFAGNNKIVVEQQFEFWELFGCEMRNRYKVGLSDSEGFIKTGGDFLFIHEESDCCERYFCGKQRDMKLMLRSGLLGRTEADMNAQPLHLEMHKPCHFQVMPCCCRPQMFVKNGAGREIGHVEDPFSCCDLTQEVFRQGQDDKPAFKIATSCCECGLWCPSCADVKFDVKDAAGGHVATASRPKLTCEEWCGMTNRMQIEFDSVADPSDRGLIFAALMLLELEYFEIDKQENR